MWTTDAVLRRCYTRQRFVQFISQRFKSCVVHSVAKPGLLHCAMILSTCLATATTEDSRESIERFNWLMSTNHCETSCTNRCQGSYTGQCSKNCCSVVAVVAKSRIEFYFSQRLRQQKNCETRPLRGMLH